VLLNLVLVLFVVLADFMVFRGIIGFRSRLLFGIPNGRVGTIGWMVT